jgi:hypothetical protein
MFRKNLQISMLLAALAALTGLAGCSEDGNEWQRLVCEVESVNAGNPLLSGYVDAGNDRIPGNDDDFLPIDVVPIAFHARPYNSIIELPEDGPNSYFDVIAYDLTWVPGPGCSSAVADSLGNCNIVNAPCYARVPVYDEGAVNILIADRRMKDIIFLNPDGTLSFGSVGATADLVFYGHESGSDELVEIRAGLQVTFCSVVISVD